jgi:hypothetical protein
MPFTVADFALCDRRHAAHFARVPKDGWHDGMVPADEWLALDPQRAADRVPYVLAADPDDVLQRVIVDSRLMQTVVRSRTFWHRLQEQGGIHNPTRILPVERAKQEARAHESKPRGSDGRGTDAAGRSRPADGGLGAGARSARAQERNPDERGSRPRAARAATSARTSTTRCSSTTTTSRPTSPTSTPGPTGR